MSRWKILGMIQVGIALAVLVRQIAKAKNAIDGK